MIIVIGLLAAGESLGQNNSPVDESNAKACVVVYGAVRAPGRVELRRRVRLAEVLAISGGVTERASGTVRIIHSGAQCSQPGITDRELTDSSRSLKSDTYALSGLQRREAGANPYLEGGEIVIVTELKPIYVVGSVLTPREIFLKEPVTLVQAIKLAGGELRDAQISQVAIHRQKKDAAGSIWIQANLEAIRKHRAEDLILQPYDIVIVPSLGWRSVGPPLSFPTFDSRPLIPLSFRIIY
jgi:protein involved in polysaccharide export with SLBB domain